MVSSLSLKDVTLDEGFLRNFHEELDWGRWVNGVV